MCKINNSTMPTRSRSQFKFMGLSLEFRVRSVSPLPLGGLSLNIGQMFTCGTKCRTHNSAMRPQGQCQGREFEPWISCPLNISFTPGRIFFYFWSNICLSEMMCRTSGSTMQIHKVTVQGHGFESWILCPLCLSFTPWRIFSKLWSNVHLSGTMCRAHNSALRT